jgi:hypothetical protein
MATTHISGRVLKVAELVRRLSREEVAHLLVLVPVLREVEPLPILTDRDEVITYFRQMAQEISGGITPSLHDKFLFGLTYEEYFNLPDEETEALWTRAFAEESARLDREPEREARPDASIPARQEHHA